MSFRSMKLELMGYVPELDAVQIGIRLNAAYKHLWSRRFWAIRRGEAIIPTVGLYVTGTVSVNAGSVAVIGIGTTWTAAMVGRYIRFAGEKNYYKIATVTPPTALTLESVYDSDTSLVSSTYTIFQHRYPVPTACAHINELVYSTKITSKPMSYLDSIDPARYSTSGDPLHYCMFDDDSLEIWPTPDSVIPLRCYYDKSFVPLTKESDVPDLSEELISDYTLWQAYMQLASVPESGAHYLQLCQMAKSQFEDKWRAAHEEDQAKLSLPTRVLVEGYDIPYDDDFTYRHDIYDPRA